jgi:hypothetical protein
VFVSAKFFHHNSSSSSLQIVVINCSKKYIIFLTEYRSSAQIAPYLRFSQNESDFQPFCVNYGRRKGGAGWDRADEGGRCEQPWSLDMSETCQKKRSPFHLRE